MAASAPAAQEATTPSSSPTSFTPSTTAGAVTAATASQIIPPPQVHHLQTAPASLTRSNLPRQLKRLAYITSLVIGGSAIFAGLWSVFILPLLHATYSARNAVAGAQKDRWHAILVKIRGIRNLGLFPALEDDSETMALELSRTRSGSQSQQSSPKKGDKEKEKTKPADARTPPDTPRSAAISLAHTEPVSPKLHADTSSLSAALRDLAAGLDATATTRTSLLSTLEGYTSGLHRELYLSRSTNSPWSVPGSNNSRVGLSTLSANLAKAGGAVDSETGSSDLGLPPARSEEWDGVRREVRAIKGLLLNRRNFAVPTRG